MRGTGINAPDLQNLSHSSNGNHYLMIIYCILKFLTSRFSANEKKNFADQAKKNSARFDSNGDVCQMVERSLIKPEVRGAIPRISKAKDIEFLINFLQKTTEY